MAKVTLDMSAFKALASDSRLSILKALDGKKMSLKDIAEETKLNKATLHEHLNKLNDAGLVKRKERKGHKWVYYCLSWKGECLLHPENTRIVVMFSAAFFSLMVSLVSIVQYAKGQVIGWTTTQVGSESSYVYSSGSSENLAKVNQTAGHQAVADSLGVSGGDIELKRAASEAVVDNHEKMIETVASSNGFGGSAGGWDSLVSTNMVIWHDPMFQTIAVISGVASVVILSIAVWLYLKNKNTII